MKKLHIKRAAAAAAAADAALYPRERKINKYSQGNVTAISICTDENEPPVQTKDPWTTDPDFVP